MSSLLAASLLAAASKSSSSGSTLLIFIVIAYAAVYFFFIRPRQKRAKAARNSPKDYEVGDTVQTVGGLIATISAMDDTTVTLRTESGQEMRFLRQAIHQKFVEPGTPEEPDEPADEAEGEGH